MQIGKKASLPLWSENLPKQASTQTTSWCSFWRPIVRADHSGAGGSHRLLPSPEDEQPGSGWARPRSTLKRGTLTLLVSPCPGFEPVNVSSAMMTAAPPATEPAPLNDTPETHPLPKTIQIVSKRDRPRIPQPNFR